MLTAPAADDKTSALPCLAAGKFFRIQEMKFCALEGKAFSEG